MLPAYKVGRVKLRFSLTSSKNKTLEWAVAKQLSGGEAPGGPWLNSPDISTLRIRIGDERLMLA